MKHTSTLEKPEGRNRKPRKPARHQIDTRLTQLARYSPEELDGFDPEDEEFSPRGHQHNTQIEEDILDA